LTVRNMLVRIQRVEKVGEDRNVELAQAKWRTLDILVLPHSIIFSDRRILNLIFRSLISSRCHI